MSLLTRASSSRIKLCEYQKFPSCTEQLFENTAAPNLLMPVAFVYVIGYKNGIEKSIMFPFMSMTMIPFKFGRETMVVGRDCSFAMF
jgi:hypothetical protein